MTGAFLGLRGFAWDGVIRGMIAEESCEELIKDR